MMSSFTSRLAAAMVLMLGQMNRVNWVRDQSPQVQLTTPQLVKKFGYAVEEHTVTTEDGYVLTLHRMPPCGQNPSTDSKPSRWRFWRRRRPSVGVPTVCPNATPVMLQHGLLGSSADWTLSGPPKGLPYLLVDAGYDVWLGNSRGNVYSRNHTSLHPVRDKQKYWDFSWHEIGVYDLPASIEHILRVTGHDQLFYVGYSQGTTAFFVMGSERPHMCQKVRAMLAMAPVAFMSHVRSPFVRMIARFDGTLRKVMHQLGMHELMPHSEMLECVGAAICRTQATNKDICTNVLFLMAGYTSKELNTTLLPLIMGHTPAGASTKQLMHYGQGINSGRFRHFDYGVRNREVYGCAFPPDYHFSNLTVPVALFHSQNDWLADTQDVMRLNAHLPRRIGLFPVADPDFTHLDFMWGENCRELVYDPLLRVMERY